ncbi:WhiB family transcriptional regulator [Actinokineospora inagensis]|uniref:WhiB family transcriptional regulator n=1 Tax=Actinokineospora inagensis TaxID=103730 RepID=UPI0003F69C18|nr:WhiB family transcriptional regulator [Actinokineospora inagensis]
MVDVSRLPRPVTAVWDWQLHAACREIDSTTFFHPEYERGPEKDERDRRAKAVCRACPVIRACRRHALLVREPYGVWGGLTVAERTALLRRIDSATWPDHYPHHEPRSTIQPTEARQHG